MAYSAQFLRDDLAYAQQTYGIKQVALIGHSMGGLLSRLQLTNSGRVLWDGVFGPKADSLYAEEPPDSLVKFPVSNTAEDGFVGTSPDRESSHTGFRCVLSAFAAGKGGGAVSDGARSPGFR
jgi:pimeloyl-ACP methyl ester carboxylesterase